MAPGLLQQPAVPQEYVVSLRSVTASWHDTVVFFLNGTKVELESIDPDVTVLEYLRGIGLTGTKLGCAEGGCGACTVVSYTSGLFDRLTHEAEVVSSRNPTTGNVYHASVNACLAPLVSVDGKHVITVEGIGNVTKPHPAQERIALGSGSQCGFCTPGIVMSLYALLRNTKEPTEKDIEEAFDGNLCRCTGYRPILDAAQTFGRHQSTASLDSSGDHACCMQNGGAANSSSCCMQMGTEAEGWRPAHKFTPPSLVKYDPETELIFPPQLTRHEFRPLSIGNKRKRWFRPVTLHQLLEIKSAYPSAKIISGSTETQIEVKFKGMHYSPSVFVGDISELRHFSFEQDHLRLGANVVLTDLENICLKAIEHYGPAKAQPFEAIYKQLKSFAGRQIRNVGTPAGNLATASPISDLNPVFVATNTTIIAKSLEQVTEIAMTDFFQGYRTTALAPNAVIIALKIPVSRSSGEYLRAYKQAKRKDDDIAIVNAALQVSLDGDRRVQRANLIYGGLAVTTKAAKEAMHFLLGKNFTHNNTLEGTMAALCEDFDLRFGVPGGMPTYRKSLALGFFYRFYQDVLQGIEPTANQSDVDACPEIERSISFGKKDLQASQAYEQKILGKAAPHVAALKQSTGEAQYTDDIPIQRNELFGVLVLSSKAHAKILEVNTEPAFDIPGVIDYVDKKDLPNPEANWWGAPNCDETFFAVDEVFTHGQPIGMILATSAKQAEVGSRAVKIVYEDLPALFTIEEAIAAESYHPHYRYIKTGDVDRAFQEADHVFTGVVRMGGQERA